MMTWAKVRPVSQISNFTALYFNYVNICGKDDHSAGDLSSNGARKIERIHNLSRLSCTKSRP